MLKKLSIGFLLAIFVSLFASSAFAQTTFDVRAGGSFATLWYSDDISYGISDGGFFKSNDNPIGGVFTLEAGIRWDSFGIYINQDIYGLRDTGRTKDYMHSIGADETKFLGATYFMFKFVVDRPNFMFDIGLGFGAMYSKDDDINCLIPKASPDESAAQFAMKFSLAFTFFITPVLGIGLHLDYSLGIAHWEDEVVRNDYYDEYGWYYGSDYSTERKDTWETNTIMPGIHLALRL